MDNNKHSGWHNYATWRVQLEIVSDYVNSTAYEDGETAERWGRELSINELADELQEYVEEAVTQFGEAKEGLALDYAMAFLDDVDYYELAEHAREEANEALKAFDEDDALASEAV